MPSGAPTFRKLYDNATHHNGPGVTGGPTMSAGTPVRHHGVDPWCREAVPDHAV